MLSDDRDINELTELVAQRTPAPPDVIAKKRLGRADILALNEMALTEQSVEVSGELRQSLDGTPTGVGESEIGEAMMGRPFITRQLLTDAGLTDSDVPNMTVVDSPRWSR